MWSRSLAAGCESRSSCAPSAQDQHQPLLRLVVWDRRSLTLVMFHAARLE